MEKKKTEPTTARHDHMLRGMPDDVWTAAKHLALDEGCTLAELITKALRAYLKPR